MGDIDSEKMMSVSHSSNKTIAVLKQRNVQFSALKEQMRQLNRRHTEELAVELKLLLCWSCDEAF